MFYPQTMRCRLAVEYEDFLGQLQGQVCVLLNVPYGGPWGVVPKCFKLKYTCIDIRNLSSKFESKRTRKTCKGTPEHTSMYEGYLSTVLDILGRLTAKPFQNQYTSSQNHN